MSAKKKEIRRKFVELCARRDRYRCAMCNTQACDHFDTHHITDRNELPNGGYVKENGITLCGVCHLKAEKFHMTKGAEWVEGFHPNDLYAKIGSSYELALQSSKKL